MTNTKDGILLIGGGGHCRAVIDVLELAKIPIAGIVDKLRTGETVLGYPVVGTDDDMPDLARTYSKALVTVGQIKSAEVRAKLFTLATDLGFTLPAIVSPLAHVSRHAQIGAGTVVMHFANVGPGASVGENCILNTQCNIEHDATVSDCCHISTGAILNGHVQVEKWSFIGSRTVCREGVNVGEHSLVGMGCVVRKDIPANTSFTK